VRLRPVTLVEGQTFCISSPLGDMHAELPEGLFYLDARVISRWELRLDGHPLECLAVDVGAPFTATFVARGAPAVGRADADVVVVRRRHIAAGMRERLVVTNHGLETADVTIELTCEADFADLFEVKERRVRRRGHHEQRVEHGGLTFAFSDGAVVREVLVRADGRPTVEPGRMAWSVSLPPAGRRELCIEVVNVVDGTEAGERFRCGGDHGDVVPVRRYDAWLAQLPEVDSDRSDLVDVLRQTGRDLGALRIVDPDTQLTVPAAGAPWFMTLFGRDSILTSWMALLADWDLASGVVQTLARLQGSRVDPDTEEEPGRIMHEVRFANRGAAFGGGEVYYGSVDATPLFVMLVGELRRWGLPDDLVDRLLPHADRALAWIEEFGDRDGDGYVEYQRATPHGLANQGWKDSWDSVRFADGALAEPPIALCEVQAYVYGAYVARSHLAREAGDHATFTRWRDKAAELRRRFDEDFWLADEGIYALGLDRDKRPIDAVTSNAGHCLWTGIAEPHRAPSVAQRLLAPDMFSGWGVRTLAASMTAYNPVSYHNGSVWPHDNAICAAGLARYGRAEEAHRLIAAQLAVATLADGQLPELFAGFDRSEIHVPAAYPASCVPQAWAAAAPLLWLRTLLGLDPWSSRRTVRVDPSLPDGFEHLRVDGIRIGDASLTVRVAPGTVDVASDGDLRVVREARGPLGDPIVNDDR
jgi:glycogen debranching enzyme